MYNLANVTWAYGAVVKAVTEDVLNADDEIVDSKLTVTLYGDKVQVIKPGRTLNLGPLVSAPATQLAHSVFLHAPPR